MANSRVRGVDVEYWKGELDAAEAALKVAMQRRDAIRRILSAVDELNALPSPDPAQQEIELPKRDEESERAVAGPSAPRGFLRGREAIKAVLDEAGREMEQRQIFRIMEAKQWVEPGLKDPFTSVRVTLGRMARKGEIRKIRDGVYAPLGGER